MTSGHEHSDLLAVVDSIDDTAVFVLDREGCIRACSRGAARIGGYDLDSVYGTHVSALYLDEDARAQKPARDLQKAADEGSFVDEGWRTRADRSAFWAHVVIRALLDDQRRPRGFGVVVRDLTTRRAELQALDAQREVELALRRSEERFRVLVEQVRDYAIFLLDAEGRVSSWNEGARRIKGYEPEEIIGKHFSIFYSNEDVAAGKPERELEEARRNGRTEDTSWRFRKDGSRFWANAIVTALRADDGSLVGYAKVTRDLTERKEVEEQLVREQVARLESEAARRRAMFLADLSRVLGASLDVADTLRAAATLAVPQLADYVIVDVRSADGALVETAVAHADAEKAALVRALRQEQSPDADPAHPASVVLRTGEPILFPIVTDTMLVALSQGSDRRLQLLRALHPTSSITVPLRGRSAIIGTISYVRTRDRHYDDMDVVVAQDLASRAGLAIENARLYDDAQKSIRLRDEFVSIASHELKTPLTSLHLHVQALMRSAAQGREVPIERLRGKLRVVAEQVERQQRLIDDLLDFSRIAAGRLQFHLEDVDLASITRSVVERFEFELARANCTVRLEVPDLVVGSWDKSRIDQVLTNLLSNAIKYGAGRPVHLTVEDRGDEARIVVRDEGIGISQEDQQRIFSRFERAVPERQYGGFGLGLWIVREIARRLGGDVSVSSAPGQGATFSVSLPKRSVSERRVGT